jgi:signal transduction histidine kinase
MEQGDAKRAFEGDLYMGEGKNPTSGLGLGLVLVREIVHLHGGEVSAKSEGLGQGSTFTIKLPLGEVVGE